MPIYITPELQLSEMYINDSIHSVTSPSEDYISYLSAGLHLNYEYAKGHLDSNLSLVSTYSNQNYFSTGLFANSFGDIAYLYTGLRWSGEINGKLVSSRFGETVSQFNEGILTTGTDYLQESSSIHGSYLLSRQTTLSMSYAYSNNDYSSTAYVSSVAQSVLLTLGYQFKSSEMISLIGGADFFRYMPGPSTKDGTGNIEWTHRTRDSALVKAGVGAGLTSGHNIYWLGNLFYHRDLEEGSVETTLSRNFGTGGGLAGTSVINQQMNLTLLRKLFHELTGSILGNVGDSDAAIPGFTYHTRFWNATLKFSYILSKSLTASVALSHYEQSTTPAPVGTLYSNQALLTFSSNFTPWRPF